ncbi:peptidase M16 domain protein [Acidothermus cellulolyticus 11B]|uniref:Peptidase M16 domain protein n=1 Tax=Acidothermus cellulolyticus (strain ATCC 43068 / DSM 8971 / 11B) TaxID=351607 RepID=A0LV19_ACIC1|nr:pitrilysin family protein [Acidothermus cellulolyticus]ABK53279.1 peptidase M16 domain protein [Acidothermus cellulolyticus 11B]
MTQDAAQRLDVDQPAGSTRTLMSGPDNTVVRRTVLPGGLRVITEAMPTVRSVAFGIWVGVGSRDETPDIAGSSHYLEHLLFKGTQRRSALDISAALDAVGGELNAFTTKEYTCFYARVLDRDLPLAVDVLADMVTSSLLRSEHVEAERGVILEEIAMRDDDPGDAVHDMFAETLFGDTPLGRPVLGTVQSISAVQRDAIDAHYRRWYRPEFMVVAAAGNLVHDEVVALVRNAFAAVLEENSGRTPAPPRIGGVPPQSRAGVVNVVSRPTEQAHFVLGMPALARTDKGRVALGVLNGALGGGMSSRLFQEVREKRGLAYSVYSYAAHHAETGIFGVYAGCQPGRAREVLDICREQLHAVVRDGLTDDELARGKGQLAGSFVLGLEDTGSRMSRLGKAELVYGELPTVDELLARIEAVTHDDIRAVAARVLAVPPTLALIGPFDDGNFEDVVT